MFPCRRIHNGGVWKSAVTNVKEVQVYKNAQSANCGNGGRLAHSSADDYTRPY